MKEHAPCYVYDAEQISRACRTLRETLQGFDLLYSIKCNPFDPVVRLIAREGFGADAASLGEVEKSLACGMAAEDIYYSAPGKSERDLRGAVGRCVLIADSLGELRAIDRIAAERGETARVGIRVYPAFTMGGGAPGPSKFGIDLEQTGALKAVLCECAHLQVVGVHVHLQSQVLDAALLARYYRRVMDMAVSLRDETGIALEFINFGSGIGVVYDPEREQPVDLGVIGAAAQEILSANRRIGARLLIESGRFAVCHAGRFLTPVVDKKTSHGVTWLIVQNAMNGFLRGPMAVMLEKLEGGSPPPMEPYYTGKNAFRVRVLNDAAERETVTVAGNLCTALDLICENAELNRAEVGDLVEISNAGSYAYSLSSLLFAGHEPPGQYLLTADGQWIGE